MGQIASLEARGDRDPFSEEYDFLHDQIKKHSFTLRQLTLLTYDDLHNKIAELNVLSSKYIDCNGKQLMFEVKPGTDATVLWKGTVRIKCIKLDPVEQKVEKSRELNLKQFLQVYNTMQLHLSAQTSANNIDDTTGTGGQAEDECCEEATEDCSPGKGKVEAGKMTRFPMDASVLLEHAGSSKLGKNDDVETASTNSDECCICMETKPEVSLPCTHSYCLACIEQWNVDHKTCPICREKLENTDDTWVLEDLPNAQDVSHEIQKNLFELTR